MTNRTRKIVLRVPVTPEEQELIRQKMALLNTRNFSAYARKMLIDGYVVHIDTTDIRAQTAELQKIGVNINQIARRLNSIKDVATCKELRPLVQEYQRAADKKQFRRRHEGTLILYEAAAKALKEQGFQKLLDLYALKDEYKLLAEQKDQLQRQYIEAKRQMQEYGIIKQNVDGILRTTPGKEQMQER